MLTEFRLGTLVEPQKTHQGADFVLEIQAPPQYKERLPFSTTEAFALTTPQTVLFPDLFDRPPVATFDQQDAPERRYGLIDGLARYVVMIGPAKVRHTLAELLAQRIFAIAYGHRDPNHADRLADGPIHKLLLGRDPMAGDSLTSQPTISRFENRVGTQDLYAIGLKLVMRVIEHHHQRLHGRARGITIDVDPTDDRPTAPSS